MFSRGFLSMVRKLGVNGVHFLEYHRLTASRSSTTAKPSVTGSYMSLDIPLATTTANGSVGECLTTPMPLPNSKLLLRTFSILVGLI